MIARTSLRWALVLGLTGFAAGFFGPMVLDPESNLGPIVGVLFTGPGGAVAGAVLGALVGASALTPARQHSALFATSTVLALTTLGFCLPEPAVRGYVIEGQVQACEPPPQLLESALTQWNAAVARVTWATPAADWRETATRNVRADAGAVATLHIERKRAIYRHRKPWDRDRSSAGPWLRANETARYYVAADGVGCEALRAQGPQTYWPAVDPNVAKMEPAKAWPPTDTLGFLRLQTLDPVPEAYRALLW